MEFGKVTSGQLDQIDFRLPADHEATTALLKKQPVSTPAI